MDRKHVVLGDIVLPPAGGERRSAEVVVVVEDVSRADAPSIVVGEQRQLLKNLSEGGVIPFAIEIPDTSINDRHLYSVRVHIGISGSDKIRIGDLVSTQSYPVLTRGHGSKVSIRVKPV